MKMNKKIKWRFTKNRFKDKWIKFLLLMICGLLVFIILKDKLTLLIPKKNIDNFITTLLATLIGGITTICLTVIINNKQNKQKAVIDRKESIYLPLYNDLEIVKKSAENSNLDYNFDSKAIENILKSYQKNIISKRIKKLLKKFVTLRNDYKNINYTGVAINIIIENFILGFRDLYGSEIERYSKERDYEGNAELVEIEYEEVRNMRNICDKNIKKILSIIGKKDGLDKIDSVLINLYDIYINHERKPIIQLPEEQYAEYGQETSKGQYIVDNYSFLEKFLNNNKIIKKNSLRERLIETTEECIEELEYILVEIYNKYEKYIY